MSGTPNFSLRWISLSRSQPAVLKPASIINIDHQHPFPILISDNALQIVGQYRARSRYSAGRLLRTCTLLPIRLTKCYGCMVSRQPHPIPFVAHTIYF